MIYGNTQRVVHEFIVARWPDGTYQVYLPNTGNSIDRDIAAIINGNAAQSLLREAVSELLDNRAEEYLHPDDREMLQEAMK